MSGKRGNGEGSIYPYRSGFAAYAWVTPPEGEPTTQVRLRQDHERSPRQVWIKLHRPGPGRARSPPHTDAR